MGRVNFIIKKIRLATKKSLEAVVGLTNDLSKASLFSVDGSINKGGYDNMAASLAVLDKRQQAAAMSTLGLDGAQKKLLATSIQQIQTGQLITSSTLKESLTTDTLASSELELLMTKNGLLGVEGKEIAVSREIVVAKLQELALDKSLSEADKKHVLNIAAKITASKAEETQVKATAGAWMAYNKTSLIIAGVTAVIAIINAVIASIEKQRQVAQDAANALIETTTSLRDYGDQVTELRAKIADENTTTEEAKVARENLLSIQDKLIEQYGYEAEGIDLVNGKLEDQIGLFNEVTRRQYSEWLTKNSAAFERAKKAMTEDLGPGNTYIADIAPYTFGEDGRNALYELLDEFSDNGITFNEDGESLLHLYFDGNVESADKTVNEFAERLRNLFSYYKIDDSISSGITQSIGDFLNNVDSIIEKHKTNYETGLLAQLGEDKTGYNLYGDAIDAVEKYNDAIASGDTGAISDAKSAIEAVKVSLDSLYSDHPEYQRIFDDLFTGMSEGTTKVAEQVNQTTHSLNAFRTQIKAIVSDTADLESAIAALSYGDIAFKKLFEGEDNKFLDDLLSKFPQLQNELEDYSNGLISASQLQDEFNNALMQSKADSFAEQLSNVTEAAERYGANSYSVQEALEELDSVFPGLLSNLSKEEEQAFLTSIANQSARKSLQQLIDTILKMNGLTINSSNIVSELNKIVTSASSTASEVLTATNSLKTLFSMGVMTYDRHAPGRFVFDKSKYNALLGATDNSAPKSSGSKSKSEYKIDKDIITGYEELTAQIEQLDKAISGVEESMSGEDINVADLVDLGEKYTGYIDQILEVFKKKRDMLEEERAKLEESITKASDGSVMFLTSLKDGSVIAAGYQKALSDLNNAYLGYAETAKKDPSDANTKKADEAKKRLEDFKSEFERWSAIQLDELPETANAWNKYAQQQKEAIQSAASNMKDDINELLDMTISLIKQGYEDQTDALDDVKDAAEKRYEAELDAIEKAKDAFDESYDARRQAIEDEYDATKKATDAKIKALDDEYDARRKILELMKENLQDSESEHDYQRELTKRTNDIAQLENKLTTLSQDESLEGAKQRRNIEEELADKRAELEEFVHDRGIELQEDAIDKALDKLSDEKDAKDKALDAELDAIETAHDATMDALEAEKRAYDKNYDARKKQIEAAKEAEIESIQRQIDAINKMASDTYAIRTQAIAMIESREQSLYNQLINWNRQYGTSIDADVTSAWQNCLSVIEQSKGSISDLLEKFSRLKNTSSLTGNSDWTILGDSVSEGTHEKPIYFHGGGPVGVQSDKFSKLMQLAGKIKSNESAAILQNGEYVLTRAQQNAVASMASASISKINNAPAFNFSMPINIAGNADSSTVRAIESAAQKIKDDVLKAFNRQYVISGLKPLRG